MRCLTSAFTSSTECRVFFLFFFKLTTRSSAYKNNNITFLQHSTKLIADLSLPVLTANQSQNTWLIQPKVVLYSFVLTSNV